MTSLKLTFGGRVAEWSGESVSPPAICRLRVRFSSPPGHATLHTTDCDTVMWRMYEKTLIKGEYERNLTGMSTRPKTPIIIIKLTFDWSQVKVRSSKAKFSNQYFYIEVRVSYSQFPQEAKYIIRFLLECMVRPNIEGKKWRHSFRFHISNTFSLQSIGFVCGNRILIQSTYQGIKNSINLFVPSWRVEWYST